MRFGVQANAAALAKTVRRLVRVAGPRTPIQMTSGGGAALELNTLSDDRAIGVATCVGGDECNVLSPGTVNVGARELARVLKMFASEAAVAIEEGWGNQLLVRMDGRTVRLNTTAGSGLRLMSARKRPIGFTVPCDSLRRALWHLPLAMARRTKGFRGAMMEVAQLGDAHRLRVCASDGGQMALFDIRMAGASPYPTRRRVYISRAGCDALVAQLGNAVGSATMEMVNGTAAVTSVDANGAGSTIRWSCPASDGFVHDPQVVLDEQIHSLVLDVNGCELRRCQRSVTARLDKGMRFVTLTANAIDGNLSVSAVPVERVNATIGAHVVDGAPGRRIIKLQIRYLLAATKALGAGTVRLVFPPCGKTSSALMLLGGDQASQRWLIMPIL